MSILTPVIIDGYVQLVHLWRAAQGQPVYLWSEEYFGAPYCPIQFEVRNDSV